MLRTIPSDFCSIVIMSDISGAQPDESKQRTFKVYTKHGDLGFTTLFGSPVKVPKWDSRIKSYGAVDELNAHLGKVREILSELPRYEEIVSAVSHMVSLRTELAEDVGVIQRTLFAMSSWLARFDYLDEKPTRLNELAESDITELETRIDQMTERLPVLKNFIMQTGEGTCDIHVTRAVCRRAEAKVAKAVHSAGAIDVEQYRLAIVYLNRLSDWLFTVARYYAHSVGQTDVRL